MASAASPHAPTASSAVPTAAHRLCEGGNSRASPGTARANKAAEHNCSADEARTLRGCPATRTRIRSASVTPTPGISTQALQKVRAAAIRKTPAGRELISTSAINGAEAQQVYTPEIALHARGERPQLAIEPVRIFPEWRMTDVGVVGGLRLPHF